MNTFKKVTLAALAISFGMTSCKKETKDKVPGIVLENMDKNVKPSDDFYSYVNGAWQKKTEIPADRTSWGSFAELRKNTDADVLKILNDAIKEGNFPKIKDAQGQEIDSDQKKAVNYYESIMDTVSRNKQGIAPLQPYLKKIEDIKSKKDIETYLINMAPLGGGGLFGFGVYNDLKDSKVNAGYLSPSGLGMSRDYYVDQDSDTKEKLKKYENYVAKMLQVFGDDAEGAKMKAAKIVAFEASLAKPRLTKEERRNPYNSYNPMTVGELSKIAPEFDWNTYFKGLGVEKLDKVIVSQPKYMKALNSIFKDSSLDDLKTYLRWNQINGGSGALTTDLEKMRWEFYSRDLCGAKEQRPRDERALATVNGRVGEALGKLYVEKKFPKEAKEKCEEMIKNVMVGFEKRIAGLEWMSEETKKKALEKLGKLTVKIAYPDKWKDYSAMQVKGVKDGGTYFDNVLSARKWSFDRSIKKLGKPVDRTEWGMSPQTVNAYFNPVNNEIVFPAAILQPPFFNFDADDAVNYGGIGAVIGHEISHSFDDSGSRYDGDGNLNNWWTDQDLEKFTARGDQLVKQFDAIEVLDSVHINGRFTLGENIGDLGGVLAAYEGLQYDFEKNGRPADIDGMTPEQRFFMSWATVWRIKMRDEALKNRIKTDPHSPGMYRAFVPLKNIDAFYEAFDVKEGDKMYLKPEDRVRIW